MSEAPLSGKPVWLLPPDGGAPVAAYYYHTRTFQRARAPVRWIPAEWWARLGSREKVGFEPVGWQRWQ
jgi:hypothetical protein